MMYSSSVGYGYKVVEVSLFFTFAQIKTEAFSQNIGKVLLISKLVSLEQSVHIGRYVIIQIQLLAYLPYQQVTTIVYVCG